MKTYFWDFFGPSAQGTAEHFEKHLSEFLSTQSLDGCLTGTVSAGAGHMSAFCTAPPAAQTKIERALRPRRILDGGSA